MDLTRTLLPLVITTPLLVSQLAVSLDTRFTESDPVSTRVSIILLDRYMSSELDRVIGDTPLFNEVPFIFYIHGRMTRYSM